MKPWHFEHEVVCPTSPAMAGFSRRRLLLGTAAAALPWAAQAQAPVWPAKPIRLIVPFPPGGTTDVVTRLVATELTKSLGQSVVVDNKPGAGTVLGVDLAAKSPADGYTLVTVANSFCVNQTLVKNLPYDGLRDLRPVGLMGMSEHVLATHPGSGLKTVADLIAAAKKQRKRDLELAVAKRLEQSFAIRRIPVPIPSISLRVISPILRFRLSIEPWEQRSRLPSSTSRIS